MSLPQSVQSHIHHKLYHDNPESTAETQHHVQRRSAERQLSLLPSYRRPVTPTGQSYNHSPSASVKHSKYSPFPSPTKPPRLLKPKATATLLPLIAKFEILDATSFGVERDQELAPRPLKIKRHSAPTGLEDGVSGVQKGASALKGKVRGLLERNNKTKNEKGNDIEMTKETLYRYSWDIGVRGHYAEQPLESLSAKGSIALPNATKSSGGRQYNLPFQFAEQVPQVSLATAATWRPHSKRRKESALGLRRESKIKDKIRFFDGSMDDHPQQTHFSEMREEADDNLEAVDASNPPIKHSSSVSDKRGTDMRKRRDETLFLKRARAKTVPQPHVPEQNHKAVPRVDSRHRDPVQFLPPDYDSSPARRSERGRTRDREGRYAGSGNLDIETTAPTTPSKSISIREPSNDNKRGIIRSEMKRKVVRLYTETSTNLDKVVNDGDGSYGRRMELHRLTGEALFPSDGKLKVNRDADGASDDNPDSSLQFLRLLDEDGDGKPRSKSLVQDRIRLFSFGDSNSRRNTSPDKDIFSKVFTIKEKQPNDKAIGLSRNILQPQYTEPRVDSRSGRDIEEKMAETSHMRPSTIKSRIQLYEGYMVGYPGKDSVPDRNSEVKFEEDLKTIKTWRIPNDRDIGAPLNRTWRAPTPAPPILTKEANPKPGEKVLVKGKEKLKQWWNEGRESLHSNSTKETPQSAHKPRSREERVTRRAARMSPEKKGKRRDSGISVRNQKEAPYMHSTSSQDELGTPLIETVIEVPAPAISPALIREVWLHSCSPTTSVSSLTVETSQDDDKPIADRTLKLVLQSRSRPARNGKGTEGNVGEPSISIVDTVVAQCELSQPRPRRLLEMDRMLRLCKRFADKEGSWSRETGTTVSSWKESDGKRRGK